MVRYRLEPAQSRFKVQAFATGLLSFAAHNPTFAIRDYRGEVRSSGRDFSDLRVELTINADSLDLEDRLRASDRKEIETRMRKELIETSSFPEISYDSDPIATHLIAQGRMGLHINGRLSLHGVTSQHPLDAELLIYDDGIAVRGECPLAMSHHGIKPVTALGGTIKLKDVVKVTFDITAYPEDS